VKIISGKYKNRNLNVIGNTRPPFHRMKQYIFDVLENYIEIKDKTILDLCAGTGSFGLECISRDAKFAYFFEENVDTALTLKKVISDWKIDNTKVIIKNVNYLPQSNDPADIVFFDPPFGHSYTEKVMDKIIKKGWIKDGGYLFVRTDYELKHNSSDLTLLKSEKIGISFLYFHRVRKSAMNDPC
jgi:16S rRNA (guanine966-N2)-methyltransferase